MEAGDRTDASLARRALQSSAGRVAIRAAGWMVAVPALCALVVIGGAAPVYLLLPDAVPVAEDKTPPELLQTASIQPSPQVTDTDDSSADAPTQATDDAVGTASAAPPPEETADSPLADEPAASPAPDETAALLPAEENETLAPVEVPEDAAPEAVEAAETRDVAVTVVPTARPVREAQDRSAASPRDPSSADQAPASRPAAAEKPRPAERREASRPTRRLVTIRPVALRSGPGGREVAMLGRGAEVLAGPCDDWCEVTSGGVTGWIHPSFLSTSVPRARGERYVPRTANPYDEEVRLDEPYRRYDRRREAPEWPYDDRRR